MASDLDIARAATLRPIGDIAAAAGIPADALIPYGRYKGKVDFGFIEKLQPRPNGALVLVVGISPTPAGEGKTTTTIGLGDALRAAGKRSMIALREPSLGPCFGQKGGATGGGHAQVAPMDEINLHFTGDFHAITSANNLLAALLDNHLYWGNALGVDPRKISVQRAIDMNDRSLRETVLGLGHGANGAAREQKFDITVASEVMAVFCLAKNLADLQTRLARMVIAERRDGSPVTPADINAVGAMTALLRDALQPNLVQTLEGTPALVHGGPFANIAHGCNSVMATTTALKLADFVVTEAGFGADLGGEKFLDIKCRQAGLAPSCAVVVATMRALKMHAGVAKADLGTPNPAAVAEGASNLRRHVAAMRAFGLPVIVAINGFLGDTEAERAALRTALDADKITAVFCTHWADGSAGAAELAKAVIAATEAKSARYAPLYPDDMPIADKLRTLVQKIYGGDDIDLAPKAARQIARLEARGYGNLPVCMAKTQYSFTADPTRRGAPSGFTLPIREIKLSAGAGFIVALAGDILTMPGLPRVPAADSIGVNADGEIFGIF
ncbi:MAG: formate--tetrahydrofolate ligase [Acidiphilium sp. 37-64-53]|uniref:formate--tetrahydrofolate ligase n=1 Tax=Acidiphilium TaxID=522 RepID=UPI000BD3080E|nr:MULTISPECIES: formate--tetrahydrofolate ligase [Acidiphilium]OYW01953.1 MAG: formate--tetrahydrofolate ligase [Acidiphilium sp. 37-64-53]OZB30320.1 MAG: formate--tetrahydrofolate ligase [Acidiphilium sp. 34-64-41]HQT85307.1 formate--tetrahydrofolate ligase [Acidiphilium rubrum]